MNKRLETDVAQIEFWWKVSKKIKSKQEQNREEAKQPIRIFLGVHNENKAILNPNPTVDG